MADAALRRGKQTQTALDDVFAYNRNVDYMNIHIPASVGVFVVQGIPMDCLHKYIGHERAYAVIWANATVYHP